MIHSSKADSLKNYRNCFSRTVFLRFVGRHRVWYVFYSSKSTFWQLKKSSVENSILFECFWCEKGGPGGESGWITEVKWMVFWKVVVLLKEPDGFCNPGVIGNMGAGLRAHRFVCGV